MADDRHQKSIDFLNSDDNFLVRRDFSELPLGESFTIVKVLLREPANYGTHVLLTLKRHVPPEDTLGKENFNLALGYPFTEPAYVTIMKEVVNDELKDLEIKLIRIKNTYTPVFGFRARSVW